MQFAPEVSSKLDKHPRRARVEITPLRYINCQFKLEGCHEPRCSCRAAAPRRTFIAMVISILGSTGSIGTQTLEVARCGTGGGR